MQPSSSAYAQLLTCGEQGCRTLVPRDSPKLASYPLLCSFHRKRVELELAELLKSAVMQTVR